MNFDAFLVLGGFRFFSTIRCRNSRLWFVNNPKLEERILAYTAKYLEVHSVELYAFAIEGSHTHDLAGYPLQIAEISCETVTRC